MSGPENARGVTRFTYSDGGRAAAGFKGEAGDCVCRAVAIAAGRPYDVVYRELSEINARMRPSKRCSSAGRRSARNGVRTKSDLFHRYMDSLGFTWTPTMSVGQGCKVHLRADELPMGMLVVRVSKHVVAVLDGVIHDTYDPSRGGTRCVYGYWRKA